MILIIYIQNLNYNLINNYRLLLLKNLSSFSVYRMKGMPQISKANALGETIYLEHRL